MAIRLVLADDHPIVLHGLEQLLQPYDDIEIVALCRDGDEALNAVRTHQPDILVLDVRMPGKDGLAVLRELRASKSPTRVVLLTAAVDDDEVVRAVREGVNAVMLKDSRPRALIECLRKVHEGGQWIESGMLGRALERMIRREEGARDAAAVLTAREIEIVRMAAEGLRNKEIAERLSISEGTVKIHLHNIYEKLKVDGRVGLLIYARDKGLV